MKHTFHYFEKRPLLEALNGLQLCKVVQHVAVELQGEAGAMAGVFAIHQHLVYFLDHLLWRHLEGNMRKYS